MGPWSRLTALALPLVISLAAPPARAFQRERSDHGARVHIAEMPVRVRLSAPVPGVPDGGLAAIRRAMASWEAPRCTALRFAEPEVSPPPSGGEGPIYEIRTITSGWPHGATLAAHTAITSDPRTGAVLRATIELNGAYRFATGDPAAEGALDLESVVLHELGHLLGLAHSLHKNAVMRAGVKPGAPPRRSLDEDDIAGVCAVYPALRADAAGRAEPPPPRPGPKAFLSPGLFALAAGALLALGAALLRRPRSRLSAAGRRSSKAVLPEEPLNP